MDRGGELVRAVDVMPWAGSVGALPGAGHLFRSARSRRRRIRSGSSAASRIARTRSLAVNLGWRCAADSRAHRGYSEGQDKALMKVELSPDELEAGIIALEQYDAYLVSQRREDCWCVEL